MKLPNIAGAFLLAFSSLPSAQAITIPTVPVGDAGNPNHPAPLNRYGGVGYAYNIGKYEVTVGQYTAFLNAVAATDTFGLYNPRMANDLNITSISRSGGLGSYTYSLIGSPDHPVTYVSWGDALRFANWLHNGQPSGPQNSSTTEDGAYTLLGDYYFKITRNAGATWFIPTQNEWFKAAYYQPAAQGGDSDGYWEYPMKTNSEPYSDQPPGATSENTRVGNFYRDDSTDNGYDDGFAVTGSPNYSGSQNYLTDVGAYASSPSYYGTFDQGGNVWEWNESVPAVTNPNRVARGGSWRYFTSSELRASFSTSFDPLTESNRIGFRVARIPEPGSATLCLVCIFILRLRRGRNL